MLVWLLACTSGNPSVATPTQTVSPSSPAGLPDALTRLELTTSDGVDLVADLHPGVENGGVVVLLHMTPAGPWNRTDWPLSFISALTSNGHTVVALDRRGAGESGGTAQDAFIGEGGRLDVDAVMVALADLPVGDAVLIGASNGTTSALDYATWTERPASPAVVGLGLMTGGTYTENQTSIDALTVPAVFTYSTAERAWSADVEARASDDWVFHEYPDGAHGTQMFEAEPSVVDELVTFVDGLL